MRQCLLLTQSGHEGGEIVAVQLKPQVANPCCNRISFVVVPASVKANATTRFIQVNYWISRCLAARGSAVQFALMFAALITFAHFSVSDFM